MSDPVDRWKNRRKMAWIAFVSGISFPTLILASESPTLSAIAIPFYSFVTLVVITYIGVATVDDKWQRRDNDSDNTTRQ